MKRTAVLVGVYLSAIVGATLVTTWALDRFGLEAAATVSLFNAFLFIGLDLTCRDALAESFGRTGYAWKMGLLIAAGGGVTWLINQDAGRFAIASVVAFTFAMTADAAVYWLFRDRPWFERVNSSNAVGAAVDSLLFPTIAFGVLLWPIVIGQFLAKVFGGAIWSVVLGITLFRRRELAT